MKNTSRFFRPLTLCLAASVLAAIPARAQYQEGGSLFDGWFVRAGARLLLNAKASISITPPASPTVYDNGYVLPDISGNSGLTWNWGYDDNAQISGSQLNFTRLDTTAGGTLSSGGGDTAPGGELVMGEELLRFDMGETEARMGFEFGYAYNPFSLKYGGLADVSYTQDTYDLGGIVPPEAPYSGSFNGPGPLLSTSHSSSVTSGQSTYSGTLDSSLHNLKLGVWLDLPVSTRMLAGVSLGYSALYADTQLTYTEQVSLPGESLRLTHCVGGRDWKPGAYVDARLNYLFTPRISAYLNAGYQYNGRFNFSGAGRDVSMDFTSLFAVGGGVSYTF